jgi:hypothetical protein
MAQRESGQYRQLQAAASIEQGQYFQTGCDVSAAPSVQLER